MSLDKFISNGEFCCFIGEVLGGVYRYEENIAPLKMLIQLYNPFDRYRAHQPIVRQMNERN